MSDNHLSERILSRRNPIAEDDPDAIDDCGSFGLLRGVKERAVMLDFRFKTGNREAFPYTLLERIVYDPSVGISFRYPGALVKITGRNLARTPGTGVSLLEALHCQRVPWINEIDELHSAVKLNEAVIVTKIEILVAK